MSEIKLNRPDLYFNGNRITLGKVTILARERREYTPSPNDRTYQVKEEDTWQTIAYRTYGSSKYWHYLCDINNILNPFEELPIGEEIVVPDIDNY